MDAYLLSESDLLLTNAHTTCLTKGLPNCLYDNIFPI